MSSIILYEKDGFISRELVQIIQNRFAHIVVKMVISCDECLTELRNFSPDIVMLGASVSDCNALDMVGQIREMRPGVCIILITDYNIDEYRKDAILKGANHIISKELWTGDEILALINTILMTKENKVQNGAESSSDETGEDIFRRFSKRQRKSSVK